jgi:DNA polymerase-1
LQQQSSSAAPKSYQTDLFGETPVEEEEKTTSTLNNIYNTPHEDILVDTAEKRKQLISELLKAKEFCFDTETTGLDPNSCELVGMSFCMKPHLAYYVGVPQVYEEACQIVHEFKPAFENPDSLKIGQNMKFDMEMLSYYGIEIKGPLFDTMLAHYLIEPDMRHNMDYLAQGYLQYVPVPIEKLIGKKGKNQISMALVPAEEIKEYAAEDADLTYKLKYPCCLYWLPWKPKG